jgi:hypothetical protein
MAQPLRAVVTALLLEQTPLWQILSVLRPRSCSARADMVVQEGEKCTFSQVHRQGPNNEVRTKVLPWNKWEQVPP